MIDSAVPRKAAKSLGRLAAIALVALGLQGAAQAMEEPSHSAALDAAIVAAAKRHGVPEHLVRRIIMRESKYNARARNRNFWGLMQISYPTAKSMGFRGTREQLLDPFVNLRYAVPYLANAFRIADRQEDVAVRLYAAGYYFTARSKGLLNALRTADSPPVVAEPLAQPMLTANAVVQPPQPVGFFGALFSPGRQPAPPPVAIAAYSAPVQPPSGVAPPAEGRAAADTASTTSYALAADVSGSMLPPKKWLHDGGMSVVARGEQPIDQMADRHAAPVADATNKKSAHRAKKITLVADLDVPLTSAPAYANAPAPDPRFASAASQAAISDATAGVTQRATPVARPADLGGTTTIARSTDAPKAHATKTAATVKEKAKVAKLARHRKNGETEQALAEKPMDLTPNR